MLGLFSPFMARHCFDEVRKQITSSVRRCYFTVESRIVFITSQLLPATKKNVLPAFQHSNIVYCYLCHCDSRYIGRTSQKLSDRIKQHITNEHQNWPVFSRFIGLFSFLQIFQSFGFQ